MESLAISTAGRPELQKDEIEVFAVEGVSIPTLGSAASAKFVARLSNLRIMLQSENKASGIAHHQIQLENIMSYEAPRSTFFWTYNNIKLTLSPYSIIELMFSQHRDTFVSHLQKQLEKKSWLNKSSVLLTTKKPPSFDPSKAGVSGIIKTVEDKQKTADQTLQEAFKDLDGLMKNAEEMVQLAGRLESKLESIGAAGKEQAQEEVAFHSEIMQKMGIWSPVTRDNTGGSELYYRELARELCEFLLRRQKLTDQNVSLMPSGPNDEDNLQLKRDIITLTDLYCIFNRARGSELISPDDLLNACKRFAQLQLPVRLQRFESSGVTFVTTASYDDRTILERVSLLIRRRGPLTAAQLAAREGISLSLAQHYMIKAEQEELLCRDESSEGLIFYPNIFVRM